MKRLMDAVIISAIIVVLGSAGALADQADDGGLQKSLEDILGSLPFDANSTEAASAEEETVAEGPDKMSKDSEDAVEDAAIEPNTPGQEVAGAQQTVAAEETAEDTVEAAATESDAETDEEAPQTPKEPIVQIESSMPEEVELDKPFTYTIKLTSLISSKIPEVVVTEVLAPNFKFTEATPVPERAADKLIWTIDSLWPKATRQFTVTGVPTTTAPLEHQTSAFTNLAESAAGTRVVQPRLAVSISAAGKDLAIGDSAKVTVVLSNPGTGALYDVKAVAALPEGLTAADGSSELSFEAQDLGPGESSEYTAEITGQDAGLYEISAYATSSGGLKAESSAATVRISKPMLAFTKTGPDAQFVDRRINYEMTVTNIGDVPANGTVLEETLPGGIISVRATKGAKLTDTGKIVWHIGTLAPDESRTIKVSYLGAKEGTIESNSIVTAVHAEPVAASAQTTLRGIPAVLLEVGDVEDPVMIGERSTYLITVLNQGSAEATNVAVECELEKGVKYVYSAGATVGQEQGRKVVFAPLESLPPKSKATWRVVVTAEKPGDVLFKTVMTTDQIGREVLESEATHIYE